MSAKITSWLWFENQAQEAAEFYVSIFKNSKITEVRRYPGGGEEVHGQTPGSVMTVLFELNGSPFAALNGGVQKFKFNDAISFQIDCADQTEVDYFWEKLSDGGRIDECGWVADKFGVSWQVVPKRVDDLVSDPDTVKSKRAFKAMLGMKKIDIAALEKAFEGA